MKAAHSYAERGTTSLVALITIATLTFIAGSFIVRITNRSREAYHSASWIEASQVCESAGSMALAEIRRVMPQTVSFPADPWAGWSAVDAAGKSIALPVSRSISAGLILRSPALILTHAGEGNLSNTATATIDAPATLLDANGQQWLRVRATGTSLLPGSTRVSFSAVDRQMRKLAFVRDWSTGQVVAKPQVSRSVEWIIQPRPPFAAALQSDGLISGSNKGDLVDSFDSSDGLKSTSGEYDSLKQQRNGQVYTNSTSFSLRGTLLGNLGTNGVTPSAALTVSGKVDTNHFETLAPIAKPAWALAATLPNLSVATSSTGSPAQYHVPVINLPLTLKANRSPKGEIIPSKVEIWVDGDIIGSITVEAGVQATIFLGGSLTLNSSQLSNPSHLASNLQIYGIEPPAGQTPSIDLTMDADLYAAVYAPGHDLTVSGTGDLMGSFTGQTIKLKSQRRVHFDEALMHQATQIIDYRVASWIEDVH